MQPARTSTCRFSPPWGPFATASTAWASTSMAIRGPRLPAGSATSAPTSIGQDSRRRGQLRRSCEDRRNPMRAVPIPARMRHPLAVLALIALSLPSSARAGQPIVLEAYVGERPADADPILAPVIDELAKNRF